MIAVECIKCDKELDKPGGILLAPPENSVFTTVAKYHLCEECFEEVADFIQGNAEGVE